MTESSNATIGREGDEAGPEAFVAEFRRWREVRGLSRTALAKSMDYSRSYVSKMESGDEPGSAEFVRATGHGPARRRCAASHLAQRAPHALSGRLGAALSPAGSDRRPQRADG